MMLSEREVSRMAKLRAIPFGYAVRDGKIIISPEDSQIVIRIFREYISGKSMHTIGDETGYGNDRIRKIICTGEYTGTERFPALIPEEMFRLADKARIARQKGRYQIPEEQKALRKMLFCRECGKNLYHGGRTGNLNSWGCYSKECRNLSYKLPMEIVMQKITDILNLVIENPDFLDADSEIVKYCPDSEIIRQQNEIRHMTENPQTDYERIKTELFRLAEMKFNCCTYSEIPQKTAFLKSLLNGHEKLNTPDIGLLKSCVKRISVSRSAVMEIEFINGVKISESEAEKS